MNQGIHDRIAYLDVCTMPINIHLDLSQTHFDNSSTRSTKMHDTWDMFEAVEENNEKISNKNKPINAFHINTNWIFLLLAMNLQWTYLDAGTKLSAIPMYWIHNECNESRDQNVDYHISVRNFLYISQNSWGLLQIRTQTCIASNATHVNARTHDDCCQRKLRAWTRGTRRTFKL